MTPVARMARDRRAPGAILPGRYAPGCYRCPDFPAGWPHRNGTAFVNLPFRLDGHTGMVRPSLTYLGSQRPGLPGHDSVRRQRRIDLADPCEDTSAYMRGVSEACVFQHRETLCAAGSALAVQYYPLVLRKTLKSGSGQELVFRDQDSPGDGDDLVLVRLPDVDEEDVVTAVEHLLQLRGGDRRAGRGLLRVLGDRPAECVVVDQAGDRRVLPADRAFRIFPDPHRAVAHLQRVIDHQPSRERVADPDDELDGLIDLDGSDRGAEHAEDAALGTGRHHARRRGLRVEAAVARAVLGPENAGLAVEAVDRSPDVGLAEQHAGVVDQVPGGKVVGAVD